MRLFFVYCNIFINQIWTYATAIKKKNYCNSIPATKIIFLFWWKLFKKVMRNKRWKTWIFIHYKDITYRTEYNKYYIILWLIVIILRWSNVFCRQNYYKSKYTYSIFRVNFDLVYRFIKWPGNKCLALYRNFKELKFLTTFRHPFIIRIRFSNNYSFEDNVDLKFKIIRCRILHINYKRFYFNIHLICTYLFIIISRIFVKIGNMFKNLCKYF